MTKYRRLGRNTLFVFLGNIGSKFIAFFLLPFYTKWLSPSDYGVVDLITVYSTLILGVVTANICDGIFVFPKGKSKFDQSSYFSSGLFFSIFCFLILSLIFEFLILFDSNGEYFGAFLKYFWSIFLIVVGSFFQKYLQQFSRSIDKVKVYSMSGVVYTLSLGIFSFLLISEFKLEGYIYSQIIALFLSSVFTFFSGKLFSYFEINFSLIHLKEMLKYTIPLIPNGIMWWLISALNRPLLENFNGTYGVGLFSVANKFPSLIAIAFTVFSYSWQISVLEEFRKENFERFYNNVLKFVFYLLLVFSLSLSVFSKYLFLMFIDDSYFEAWKFVPILSLSALLSSLSTFIGVNFTASRESKYFFLSSIWAGLTSVFLNFLLIPYFGLIGACISVMFSNFVLLFSRCVYSNKYTRIFDLGVYVFLSIIHLLIVVMLYVDSIFYYSFMVYVLVSFYLLYTVRDDLYRMLRGNKLI